MKTKLPNNLACWMWTFERPEEVNAFIERGNEKQHKEMKQCLIYLKGKDERLFEKVNGKEILKRLRKKKI